MASRSRRCPPSRACASRQRGGLPRAVSFFSTTPDITEKASSRAERRPLPPERLSRCGSPLAGPATCFSVSSTAACSKCAVEREVASREGRAGLLSCLANETQGPLARRRPGARSRAGAERRRDSELAGQPRAGAWSSVSAGSPRRARGRARPRRSSSAPIRQHQGREPQPRGGRARSPGCRRSRRPGWRSRGSTGRRRRAPRRRARRRPRRRLRGGTNCQRG